MAKWKIICDIEGAVEVEEKSRSLHVDKLVLVTLASSGKADILGPAALTALTHTS